MILGHWTLTLYENIQLVQYKYYDIVQDQNNLDASAFVNIRKTYAEITGRMSLNASIQTERTPL